MQSSWEAWLLSLGACAVIAGAVGVSTAEAADSGWYVGANLGQSRAKIGDKRIAGSLLDSGFVTTSINDDDTHFGYKLFGGYRLNRYFALEGGYFDLGRFGFTAITVPAGSLSGTSRLKGLNFDAIGSLPLTHKLAAFARAGVAVTQASDSFSATGALGAPDSDRKRAANLKFGAGLSYAFIESLSMRLEAERYRVDDAVGNKGDIDLLSIGLVYRFGTAMPLERASQSIPPPAPIEEPAVVLVPVEKPEQQYCSILDIQFEINQDDIQLQEKEKLAVLGTFMKKYPETRAVIEGHTDNVGSAERNLLLSQHRAQSVVSYLVHDLDIAAFRLSAVGYGELRPIADNRTEEGKRLNRRIDAVVACATDIADLAVKPARLTMALLIEFDRNSTAIRGQYREDLRRVAVFLKANPSVTATVEGHTGNLQATPARSLEISRERAQNVVNYLVENFDIARSRLAAEGFGERRRFAYNTSQEGQQENRRVNIIIDYPR